MAELLFGLFCLAIVAFLLVAIPIVLGKIAYYLCYMIVYPFALIVGIFRSIIDSDWEG